LITFLSKVKYTIGNAIVIVTYEISYNIRKHFKTPTFLKYNVYYTGAVTEGQQTSDNFHRRMLPKKKKPTTKNPQHS